MLFKVSIAHHPIQMMNVRNNSLAEQVLRASHRLLYPLAVSASITILKVEREMARIESCGSLDKKLSKGIAAEKALDVGDKLSIKIHSGLVVGTTVGDTTITTTVGDGSS